MANEETTQKWGTGHGSAMFRQGLAELRAAMYPESNVAQPPAYGIAGTKTPGEVMQEKQGEVRDPDERPSMLDERTMHAETRAQEREPDSPARDNRDIERE